MLLILMVTSKGMAGVPRASLVVIAATLATFNIPEAGLLLIMGIDQFLDMGRSATNVDRQQPGHRRRREVGRRVDSHRRGRTPALKPRPPEAVKPARRPRARRRQPRHRGGCHVERSSAGSALRWSRCAWRCRPRRRSAHRTPAADRDAEEDPRHRHRHDRLSRELVSVLLPRSGATSRSATRSISAWRSSTSAAPSSTASACRSRYHPVTPGDPDAGGHVGRDRPRMRVDDQQRRAPEGGGVLADLLRDRHQAPGAPERRRSARTAICGTRPSS